MSETPCAPPPARRTAPIGALVFVGVLCLLLATDSQYGITYDEPIYQAKSLQALQWLKLLVADPSMALSPEAIDRYWRAKDQHPGFFKLLTGVCASVLLGVVPDDAALRAGTNLLCALCFATLFAFVAGLWGRAAGLYAVGALLLMPRVFGHCHLAALDAPIMAMSFLVLAASWRACTIGREAANPRGAWPWAIAAGLLWGLALSTKLNAFFIPFVVFPWALVFARDRVLKLSAAFAIGGPAAFLASWPWLWRETWPRFLEYFAFHFKHWEIGVTYFGEVHTLAPWHYPLVMTAITVPPTVLALACLGVTRLRRPSAAAGAPAIEWRRTAALALVVWALLVNIIPSCLPSTPKYNGVRLFLPIFPLIAILAAVGFREALTRVLAWVQARVHLPGLALKLSGLCLFLALLGPLSATARFAPFHLSYYNALIGGLPGAARVGMEPTYWGDAYRSACSWLAEKAEPGATIWIEPGGFESTVRLFELGPLRPDLTFSAGPEGFKSADYAVTQNKSTEFTDITRRLVASARPVFVDGVDGVPVIYVFRLRRMPEERARSAPPSAP